MDPLCFDDLAQAIIACRLARRPDAVLQLTIRHSYGRGGPYSFVLLRWTTRGRAERDAGPNCWQGPHGVPVFIVPRLGRYLNWHPLRVHGVRLGPFSRLVPATDPLYVSDLCQWERAHPA